MILAYLIIGILIAFVADVCSEDGLPLDTLLIIVLIWPFLALVFVLSLFMLLLFIIACIPVVIVAGVAEVFDRIRGRK